MENFESRPDNLLTKYARINYMEAFFIIGATGYFGWHWVYQGIVESVYDQLWFRAIVAFFMLSTAGLSMYFKWKRKRLEFAMFLLLTTVYAFDTLVMCRYNPGGIYQTFGMYILGSIMVIGLREMKYVLSFCGISLGIVAFSQLYFGNYLAGTIWFHLIGLGTIFFYGIFFQWEKSRESKKFVKQSYLHSRVEEVSSIGGWYLSLITGEFWVSPKIEEMWKIKSYDSFKVFDNILGEKNYRELVQLVKNLKEFIDPFDVEFEVLDQDGNQKYYKFTGRAFEVENGECAGLIGTISDISKMKYLEKTIELEREKTLVNNKLSALGDLAAGMAHEINNPLTVIFGAVKKIKKDLSDEEKDKLIQRTQESVKKITTIITELQRASVHHNVFSFTMVNLNQLIQENLDQFVNELDTHKIQVRLVLPDTDVLIKANKSLFSQVIYNLVSNAIDAIKDYEEKWIEIELKDLNERINLYISDSGHGIDTSISNKIMDPFFSTKKVGAGTGLGLSTCYTIVKQHGGTLYLNKKHQNTQFIIDLIKQSQLKAS